MLENIVAMSYFGQNNVILNYLLFTLISYINFNIVFDFITTKFYFTVKLPKGTPVNPLLTQYVQNNPEIIVYKKHAKLENILENRKLTTYEKIMGGFLIGQDYTLIRHGWNLFSISRKELEPYRRPDGELNDLFITSYWGGEISIIRFLATIKQSKISLVDKLEISRHNSYGEWYENEYVMSGKRIENIVMEKGLKASIISDVDEFVHTEKWYHDNMIIHKRGYLLYGKPGCGKTSFVLALAAKFNMTIKVVKLQILMEENYLDNLFRFGTSSNVIYLMEDIDCIETDRGLEKKPEETEVKKQKKISLSGLLNVLDGVVSAKNCIFIMTTNHIDKLDSALIRPGRIDRKIEFPEANRDLVLDYFHKVYPNSKLNPDFNKIMGDKTISMAEVQNLVIQNKTNAVGFLEAFKDKISTKE